jgi:uncharacterized damage-inducible protein DinB
VTEPVRVDAPFAGDERATLVGFLEYQRATLSWKCHGLNDVQLRTQAVPPSTLSLLGLIRHMAEVERGWFRQVVDGEDIADRWTSAADPGADFNQVADADVDEAFGAWNEECERSRRIVAATGSLGTTSVDPRLGNVSLRWVLVHMIEEYARHNGHADLLREHLDGATGE